MPGRQWRASFSRAKVTNALVLAVAIVVMGLTVPATADREGSSKSVPSSMESLHEEVKAFRAEVAEVSAGLTVEVGEIHGIVDGTSNTVLIGENRLVDLQKSSGAIASGVDAIRDAVGRLEMEVVAVSGGAHHDAVAAVANNNARAVVHVTSGGTPVEGLTSSDFDVRTWFEPIRSCSLRVSGFFEVDPAYPGVYSLQLALDDAACLWRQGDYLFTLAVSHGGERALASSEFEVPEEIWGS